MASEARAWAEARERSSLSTRRFLHASFCLLNLLANFDAGVLPSTLSHVRNEFKLSYTQCGALGAVVYLGLMVACPATGYLLTKYRSQRRIVLCAVLFNTVAVWTFGSATTTTWLFVGRAMIGFSQAPMIIYAPVWVDEFAPRGSLTKWMSLLQGSVAIGVMLGYLLGGAATSYIGEPHCPPGVDGSVPAQLDAYCYNDSWRIAVKVQAVLISPFALIFFLMDAENVDAVGGSEKRIRRLERFYGHANNASKSAAAGDDSTSFRDEKEERDVLLAADDAGSQAAGSDGYGGQLLELLRSKLYVLLTLGLCTLYFVVTGIQFWVTAYMTLDTAKGGLGEDPGKVIIMFGLVSLLGPTLGVVAGGYWIDRMGGYKDDTGMSVTITLRSCSIFAFLAACCAVVAAFSEQFWVVIMAIWMVLFFGGAILPACSGIAITAVSLDMRSISSATSMWVYNLFGFAAAPWVCGLIAERVSLQWGFRIVMLMSWLGFFYIFCAYLAAKSAYLKRQAAAKKGEDAPPSYGTDGPPGQSTDDRFAASVRFRGAKGSEIRRRKRSSFDSAYAEIALAVEGRHFFAAAVQPVQPMASEFLDKQRRLSTGDIRTPVKRGTGAESS